MTDAEKLKTYARAVEEMRRLHVVTRKPPNAHERREIAKAESEVDRLTRLYAPTEEEPAPHPAQPPI